MGKWRFEYEFARGKEAQVGIRSHVRATYDGKLRRMVPAQLREFAKFHDGLWGTDDPEEARALEATGPFKRNEIRRRGAPVPKPAPARPAAPTTMGMSGMPDLQAILLRLGALPLGGDDGLLDAIRL